MVYRKEGLCACVVGRKEFWFCWKKRGMEHVEEDAVVLDRDGRPRGVTGGLEYGFQNFEHAVKGRLDLLREDCAEAFTAREMREGDEYSSGETFFIPAEGVVARCELERLALAIFDAHVKHAVGVDRFNSGAEWWTQVIDEYDEVGFHFDRDYSLEAEAGINVHPHLATVTYLGDAGGPTIVLNLIAPSVAGEENFGAGSATEGFFSCPEEGKHISFDGRYLHAASADLCELYRRPNDETLEAGQKRKAPAKRITFLVNIWLNYRPLHAEEFPEEKVDALKTPVGTCPLQLTPTSLDKLPPLKMDRTDKLFNFEFVEASREMEVNVHLSASAFQENRETGLASFRLSFDEGACVLEVGDPVTSEVDDQELLDEEDEEDPAGDSEEDEA